MALDTSNGAYEQLFDTSAPENSDTYYEGYVEMKNFIKWSKYWCVLKKKNLHFFKDVNTQIKENYVGFFPLDGVTNIELKGKSNEWQMIKKSRKIILKTQNSHLRDTWLESFKKSLKGEAPVANSYILPGSGPVSPVKRQPSLPPQCSPPSSPPPSSPSHGQNLSRRKSSTGSVRYPDLPQIQTETDLNDRVQQIADNAEMTAADIKIQEQLMTSDKSWYQPSLRREDVSEILEKENNGVFIVRDYIEVSSSRNMGYVISLKDNAGGIRHHKIEKTPDGNLHIKGHEGKRFDALHNLLRFFIVSQRKTINLQPPTTRRK
ncbi:Hypothetical predicted protein [Paramuricea clavata]|uniref:Uncharacterized protein n=1 Tax=Paramuricea clavata TaxID=317549 RepID=A0A6S7H0Q5_PARCT|nr:Hypothetical predicted protein [Paramuricea clavata]